MMDFSDYVVYVDESGDHNLKSVNQDYPVFVLAFCVIHCDAYINHLSPVIQKFKYEFWGHDEVILHEHDIRKQNGCFGILRSGQELRDRFFDKINEIIKTSDVGVINTLIDKDRHIKKYVDPWNPYSISLVCCMRGLLGFLLKNGQEGKRVHVIFESRGKKEDNELELEFRRICDNRPLGYQYKSDDFSKISFEILFLPKAANSIGLQFADLVARPIGLNYLRPTQANRAYEIIKDKIIYSKIFP